MSNLKQEREVLVQARFYLDKVDPNAANLPDLLRDKFETEVDRNNIFFSICIPGSSSDIKLKDIVQQNNDLSHQVKFWQELYLKAIDPK
jgi:hypothetical protein